jgi:hypothetical protein
MIIELHNNSACINYSDTLALNGYKKTMEALFQMSHTQENETLLENLENQMCSTFSPFN